MHKEVHPMQEEDPFEDVDEEDETDDEDVDNEHDREKEDEDGWYNEVPPDDEF
jgi:hypothetical protein